MQEKIKTSEIKVLSMLKGINPYNDEIPKGSGTYIITFISDERYIGSTKNLRSRIRQHKYRWSKHYRNENIKSVDIYLTENINHAYALELILIMKLKPELNKCIPKPITESERIYKINGYMENIMESREFLFNNTKKLFISKLIVKGTYIEVDRNNVFWDKSCTRKNYNSMRNKNTG